jgi:FlaA1/EpsC-like NDP-sugar epimerase
MKTLLLPHSYKRIGWILFVPSFIALLFFIFFGTNITYNPTISTFGLFGDELLKSSSHPLRFGKIELLPNLTAILFLVGGLLVMFSKEKKEDEYINQIRLTSLQYSVFLNYILLFFCILFIHGFAFFNVMVYNLFTIILIYIMRFHFFIYKNSSNNNEQ